MSRHRLGRLEHEKEVITAALRQKKENFEKRLKGNKSRLTKAYYANWG
jgi:hypothetical protein